VRTGHASGLLAHSQHARQVRAERGRAARASATCTPGVCAGPAPPGPQVHAQNGLQMVAEPAQAPDGQALILPLSKCAAQVHPHTLCFEAHLSFAFDLSQSLRSAQGITSRDSMRCKGQPTHHHAACTLHRMSGASSTAISWKLTRMRRSTSRCASGSRPL